MANTIDLNGRIAVVTGGAQGIGRAIVERLLASGAAVAIWDRDGGWPRRPPTNSSGRGKDDRGRVRRHRLADVERRATLP